MYLDMIEIATSFKNRMFVGTFAPMEKMQHLSFTYRNNFKKQSNFTELLNDSFSYFL